jgi:protein phosphatase 4 regulatory subunit 3
VAALTILQSQAQLSLQQHLDLSAGVIGYIAEQPADGEPQPGIMAQAVPNPPTERKRVKVYELRNNDWFDRGTGFCSATIVSVSTINLCLYKHAQHEFYFPGCYVKV